MEKPWELMPVLRTCQRDRSKSQRHESVTGSSSENTDALGGSLDVRAHVSLSKSRWRTWASLAASSSLLGPCLMHL